MGPSLAATLDAARDVAWYSHVNLSNAGLYAERREAWRRLRETRRAVRGLSANASPQLVALVAAIDRLATCTHANVMGLRYYERRQAMAQLRGCFDQWDRARGEVVSAWPRTRAA